MTHEDVVKRCAARKINSRTKTVQWTGSNIFCEGNVIYSYGRHFPLAVYLGDEKFPFIRNLDKYSSSTSCHQGIVSSFCEGPEFSESDLESKKINFLDLKPENFLFYRDGINKLLYQNKETGSFHEDLSWNSEDKFYNEPETTWIAPIYGKYRPFRKPEFVGKQKKEYTVGIFVAEQVAVLIWKNKYYLTLSEKRKSSIYQLKTRPETISDALLTLETDKTNKLFAAIGKNLW